jgi:murein DD-endopeptidase MepM/ murein hydrolase activator NlpD
LMWSIVLLGMIILSGCAVSNNPLRKEVRMLRKGIIKDDTSYVYSLPYEPGKSYWMVQGYFSHYTHKERAALDFKMKRGTAIHAARGGVVVRVKEDGDRGGLNKKYRPFGNNIVIQHDDNSRAGYWHLQKDGAVVNVGDTVKQGQLIGYSGKTGYTMFPHLHFLVWDFDDKGQWRQVPTRFQTSKGVKYLNSIHRYKIRKAEATE